MEGSSLLVVLLIVVASIDCLFILTYLFSWRLAGAISCGRRLHGLRQIYRCLGFGFIMTNSVNAIWLSLYIQGIASKLRDICPKILETPDICIQATKEWKKALWGLTAFAITAYLILVYTLARMKMVASSGANPPYFPKAHFWSCMFFHLSLALSGPLAYPTVMIQLGTKPFLAISILAAVLMISALTVASALCIQGIVFMICKDCSADRRASAGAQRNAPHEDDIELEDRGATTRTGSPDSTRQGSPAPRI